MQEKSEARKAFFNPKSIGRDLKEVAIDIIDTPQDSLISRWFQDGSGVDLYTWSDSKEVVIKQQISFHGQVVEWNCLDGLKTGVIIEVDMDIQSAEETEKALSETVQFDSAPQKRSIDLALEILKFFESDKSLKKQLISNFENPQNIKTLRPKDFIGRFGMAIKNYQGVDAGFWESLKRRFQDMFNKDAA